MPGQHLSIGTETDRINLLSENGGFQQDNWEVGGTELDAIFQESQLADFRQMAAYRDITVVDTFNLTLEADGPNTAARYIQDLRAMLRLMADYWTSTWQTEVVYLAARASCESNMRYAVVHDGRLVGESNPFGQPFLQVDGSVVMDALALIVERGPWLENAPGTGTCVEISSQGPDYGRFLLEFDGVDDLVNCGSLASIDDLPDADFTAEAWIKAFDWGENSSGFIFGKSSWLFAIQNRNDVPNCGLWAYADHAVTNARTTTDTGEFYPDNQWHHVVAVWTKASLQWDIAIDGIWVDTTITVGAGAYTSDAGSNLFIGNQSAAALYTFDGDIGWCRLSSSLRYTVGLSFTPPDRCTCPTVDGDTEGLWCLTEGEGATAYDETANNNDGTITGATWLYAGCETEYMEATCNAQSVFVANKHNAAQLTHVRYWDDSAGAWNAAGNLLGAATPFAFLPAVPGADDFALFGIDTSLADSGPFCSLVFDIGTAIDPGTGVTIQWRYKATGDADDPGDAVNPWSTLTVQDNTNASGAMTGDPFDTTGIGSVHWEQPADWETSNPNAGVALGVTGYWVAAYVTASNDDGTPPTQDNRNIYTVTWPYVDFTADQVSGDMPALLRFTVDTRSAQDGIGTTTDLWCQRVIAGLRSYDRGEDFTAYVNISREQNSPAISLTLGGGTAWQSYSNVPTGEAALYTAAGVDAIAVRVYATVNWDFYGRYHVFVRGKQVTGAAGTIDVRLEYAPGDSSLYVDRKTITRQFPTTSADMLLDFGEIILGPQVALGPYVMNNTYINIEAGASGAASCYFYDIVLIPVDEWAIDCEDMFKNTGAALYTGDYRNYLNVDAIQNPRQLLSHLIRTDVDRVMRYWRPITNGIPILQTGKHQRLWFLTVKNMDYADVDDTLADPEQCHTIQIWKNQRYSTLRGDQ